MTDASAQVVGTAIAVAAVALGTISTNARIGVPETRIAELEGRAP
jgi:hypothetical protein